MTTIERRPEVMTAGELAEFLRVSESAIEQYAARSWLPGRQIEGHWRFWRAAIEEWLRGKSGKEVLLSQFGALEDDATDLDALRASVCVDRSPPEVDQKG